MQRKASVDVLIDSTSTAPPQATEAVRPYDHAHAQRVMGGQEHGEGAQGTPPSNTVTQYP